MSFSIIRETKSERDRNFEGAESFELRGHRDKKIKCGVGTNLFQLKAEDFEQAEWDSGV